MDRHKVDYEQNLFYLVPKGLMVDFEKDWEVLRSLLKRAIEES